MVPYIKSQNIKTEYKQKHKFYVNKIRYITTQNTKKFFSYVVRNRK